MGALALALALSTTVRVARGARSSYYGRRSAS
jgi:hypothetical protein